MSVAKSNHNYDQYMLRGKLRKNGFEHWRYIFCGVNKITNLEKVFFVEMFMVNPDVSPATPVVSHKTRTKIDAGDLQYALTGNKTNIDDKVNQKVQPSYVLIKAGAFGERGKQINKVIQCSELKFIKNGNCIKAGDCIFGEDTLTGTLLVTEKDLLLRAEIPADAGSMDWNLHYERNIGISQINNKNDSVWIPYGCRTIFLGSVHLDGIEYEVVPANPSGYCDKTWGTNFNDPFVHISCSNIVSRITGQTLEKTCFTIENDCNNNLRGSIIIEGREFPVKPGLFKSSQIHDCAQMPKEADGDKLHWSVSLHIRQYIVDIDVYCKTQEMFLKNWESPDGSNNMLKVLCGGSGKGDIKIFKKIHRNLETIEMGKLENVICEYGTRDDQVE